VKGPQNLADGLKLIKDAQFFGKLLAVVSGEGNGSNITVSEFIEQIPHKIQERFIRFSKVASSVFPK
jgi:hypothetical protein